MSQVIYNIDNWAQNTFYYKDNIVRVLEGSVFGNSSNNYLYYYALSNHTSSSSFNNDLSSFWAGYIQNNGENKPQFIWKPSYNWSQDSTPRIKSIILGDGYEQIIPDGINNILISLNLSFDNIDINEYTAILHFLESRRGAESFIYIPPAPKNIPKRFICKEWNDTQVQYNNYTIKCQFKEQVF